MGSPDSPSGSPLGGDSNGFTAVNGRNSPSPRAVRINEEPRSQHPDEQRRGGSGSNDERVQRVNGSNENLRNGSPLNTSTKRKRSLNGNDEEEEEDYESNSEDEDESPKSHPNHSRAPPGHSWNGNGHHGDVEPRLVEAFERERQQSANGHGSMEHDSPHGGPTRGYQPDEYTGMITTNAGVQMDPKKRKRAFTNRTKTGCQTCRRRKKKCDEGKPECHNCQRGGFVCEGYAAKSPWPKPAVSNKLPMPIQAREIYGEPGNLYPRPPRNDPYMESPSQPHPNSRGRPVTVEDEPERPMGAPWPNSPYGVPQRSYPHDREPSHAMPMQNHSLQMRDHDRGMTSAMYSGIGSMHNHGLHQQSPVVQAQQALQQQRQPNFIGVEKSEKEKMLSGELYKPYCPPLVADRDACKSQLVNFNTSTDVGRDERARQLQRALKPSDSPRTANASPIIGKGAYVDPPFRCEFVYNIIIGEDVAIESNCFISNPREVVIGKSTFIGPDVKIMGKQFPFAPGPREGGALHGRARGYKITIGENVCLGAGCIISPSEDQIRNGELTIGNGAYIPAGTVIRKNVPANTIFGHKPVDEADVVRTLYGPDEKRPDARRIMRNEMAM